MNPVEVGRHHATLRALDGRPLYVWGAGHQGRGLCRVLERQGIRIDGFVDTSPFLQGTAALGHPVIAPAAALAVEAGRPRPFIVIASFFHERSIGAACEAAGLVAERDFLPYTAIKPFDYAIDVTGACNLRCISCPHARREGRAAGMMSVESFERVVGKILREDPLAGSVQLYQWGEPLLNPAIGEIVRCANERGLECAISSNLNDDRNLEPAIRARPAWFRVSVSGWGARYERTHTGGAWTRFHRNFLRLADLRRAHNPEMKTEVYYHLYRDNQGDDLARMRELCAGAGFELHPVPAYLISLDDVLAHLEGAPLPEAARAAAELLALPLAEGIARAQAEREEPCLTMRCIHVRWDLSVSDCMMFFDPEGNRAAESFLETPLAEIVERRNASPLCGRCMKHALHRYCSVYATAAEAGR